VSRPTRGPPSRFPIRGCHPLRPAFPDGSGTKDRGHWPGPRSLATTSGVSVDVLSSGLLRCFSSPGSPPQPINSAEDTLHRVGCPIRRSRDQRSLASPPGFSQRATSFIASQCQGIHQMPFLALERHTQRQEPFQGRGARNQGSGITPRLAPCRSATNFSQKTLHAGCTRTAHPDKPSGRARFPATVTQLASLRCYINNPPGCPHRVLPRGAPGQSL
jgi:hypothetical protein